MALQDQGKLDAAAGCYHRARKLMPQEAAVCCAAGDLEHSRENLEKAIACYRQALALGPKRPEIVKENLAALLNRLGNQQRQHGFPRRARQLYLEALDLLPACGEYAFNLGLAQEDLGFITKAITAYRQAWNNNPHLAQAALNLAILLREQGRFSSKRHLLQEAETLLETAHALAPDDQLISDNLMRLNYLDLLPPQQAIPALERQLRTLDDPFLQWRGQQLLSRLCDREARYREAFTWAESAHRITPDKYRHFNRERCHRGFVNLQLDFAPAIRKRLPRSRHCHRRPLFIVGMPRSGTTLIEQVLTSHPQIASLGESAVIIDRIREMKKEHNLDDRNFLFHHLNPEILDVWATEEEERLSDYAPEASLVINKLPGNFLYLGIIDLLFPGARIIHCRRRPADTIISIFLQDFIDPPEYSHTISDLIFYYHHYLTLMEHWQRVLDLEIIEIHYEQLVTHLEQETRRLLNFLELEWDPACLNFHKKQRLIKTASRDQVRKPLYRKSLDRWRNYQEQLIPWIKELQRLDRRAGYTVST